jgi:PKHD-type hydroxylase
MIHILPALLPPDTLAQAQRLLSTAPWVDGRASAGPQARAVKDNLQLPHDCPEAEQIRSWVLAALQQSPEVLSVALPRKIFTPRINRYDPEHPHYGWHVDNAIRLRSDGQHVRTDISCTVFLSEPGDYEGGELVVRDRDTEHVVKLPAGSAVLYPGTTVHEVRPVTRGARLACFLWIESMVRSNEQRQLLHELDMNILALREQHGESEPTTALTGVYHNLLRLWADT